ncbi:hypothetical protein OG21DRAFT_1021139 [Imleria badia]|nr:hypothetical protein OG21DRAFT_1021139 [Imleria badia]
MHATRQTSSAREQGVLQRTCWRETTYATVSWDYPPSPAAYHDALLSRGASHSRFLRIAYLSTRHPYPTSSSSPPSSASPLDPSPTSPALHLTSTIPLTCPDGSHRKPALHLPPMPPHSLSRSCVHSRPRSANPMAHTLKRRKPHWPKPPHYHAALLRSPLSHRKGLFRAVLPPGQAVDFFRWDVLVGAGVSLDATCQERDWRGSRDLDACASLHVVESVLAPYEAAAGFSGWHGLGLDVARCVEGDCDEGVEGERCWSQGLGFRCEGRTKSQLDVDEAAVDEGRAMWARAAEELVGPSGLVLRSVVEDGKSRKALSDLASKYAVDAHSSSISSRRDEFRWDPDNGSSPFRPPRATSASDEKRQSPPSSTKRELKMDPPSAWWYGHSLHGGPPPTPHLPPLRFLPPPSVHFGPPPMQFSPWFPGRVASAQGHGYWYSAQPVGAPSPMPRDPNLAKSHQPHSHVFATPTSIHPNQSPRYPTNSSLRRDEYGPGHDDKETETDHGYESTTTTTDSDPPPHTPVGAATTSHCVEALQLHGDDEVEVHGVDIDAECAAGSVTIRLSDPSTPVKVLDRFSMSAPPSVSSDSPDSHRGGCESARAMVVFPSLNGSFRQGSSSHISVLLSSPGTSAQTTPAGTMTPISSSSLSSSKELTTRPGLGDDEDSKTELNRDLQASPSSSSGDSPALTLSLCSPPLRSPRPGLRKDSQGFWEPVTPVSPSSSSSSLPLSPSEGKTGSRPTAGWIGDKAAPVSGASSESSEVASPPSTLFAKSRSLSPDPRRATSVGSTRSSSSQPASFSSPISTSASASVFGGSYPSSPSPPNNSSLISPSPTTLLPAFLATATVKRKKASRTREIVDRLRSSSIDAGKGGVGLDTLGWLASPSASGEMDGKLGKTSDHASGNHVASVQPSPSPPSQSGADSAPWVGSDLGKKDGQAPGSKSSDAGSPGSGTKGHGTTQAAVPGSETRFSHASPGTVTTADPSITPFPILSVPQTPVSNFTTTRQGQIGGTPPHSADGSKMNAPVATSPNARSSGPQHILSTPNGGTSPSGRSCHHPLPLPSPSHPTVHPQPPLGPPPPILAVSPYPPPMYVPFTQYHLAPPHQGQQGQGTWLAVYPGRPPHVPMHGLPAQTHVITGVSGMRHVSW